MANSLLERAKAFNNAEKNQVIDYSSLGINNFDSYAENNTDKVVSVELDELKPFTAYGQEQPFVCRPEKVVDIAQSIKEEGQLTPIAVRRKEDGTLEIISGHTRVKALKHCGYSTVNAIIFDNVPDDVAFKKLGYGNVQRSGVSPSEIANLCVMSDKFKAEGKEHFTREEIAHMTGCSRKHVNRCLNVSKLNHMLRKSVDLDIISVTAVEDILNHLTDNQQLELAEYIDLILIPPARKKAIKNDDDVKYSKLTVSKLKKIYELADYVAENPYPNSLDIDFTIDGIKEVLSAKNFFSTEEQDEVEEKEPESSSLKTPDFFTRLREQFLELQMYDDEGLENYISELIENAVNGDELLDLTESEGLSR